MDTEDMPTPMRAIRIDDDLWNAAKATAEEKGTTVTDVIRKALSAYVKGGVVAGVAVLAVVLLGACGGAQAPAAGTDEPVAQSSQATPTHDRKKDRDECTTSEDVTVAWRSVPLAAEATVADFEALLDWAAEQTACDDDAQVQIDWLVDTATLNIERLDSVN